MTEKVPYVIRGRSLKRKWGEQWDTQLMTYLENLGPIFILKDKLARNRGKRCLIVGAASETNLVSKFTHDIIGINISRKELKKINLKTGLILGDAQNLPIRKSSVDFIVCKSTLHHLNNPDAALLEMNRVLRKEGYIVLYEPGLLNPIAFVGRELFPTNIHESSEKPFNPISLRKLLSKRFQVIMEKNFFVFVHVVPILAKKLSFLRSKRLLSAFSNLDNLLCKTFLKNLCWIMVFELKNK